MYICRADMKEETIIPDDHISMCTVSIPMPLTIMPLTIMRLSIKTTGMSLLRHFATQIIGIMISMLVICRNL